MGGLLAFRVGNYDNTAEREQFRFLCGKLKAHYENLEDFCVFVGNYNIGCELDALFIKKDAIISIEFKNYGGKVVANENGEWTCDGKTIKGGSRKTVLQQARINHSIVKKELNVLGVEKNQIKDVPHLIIFHQPIELENNLSATNKSWLHITDDAHFIEKLDDITCPKTDLNPLAIVNLAELLNLNSYYLTEFSNVSYESQAPKENKKEIFEDIKKDVQKLSKDALSEAPDTLHQVESLSELPQTGDVIDPKEIESQSVADEVNALHSSADLIPLKEYAHQIINAVFGVNDIEVFALNPIDFGRVYPSFMKHIDHEFVVLLKGRIAPDQEKRLYRFLQKDMARMSDDILYWQTGERIVSQTEEGTLEDNPNIEESASIPSDGTLADVDLPNWLDRYLFFDLGAKYSPNHSRFEYNLNLNTGEIKVYLGTYFPRSFVEVKSIFEEFSQNSNYLSLVGERTSVSILDLGCGTGGDLFGLLSFLEKYEPSLKSVKLLAIDGSQMALRFFEKIMAEFKKHSRLKIDYRIGPVFIESENDLNLVSDVLSAKYDLILSCKAICEMLAKRRIKNKAYKQTASMLSSKLTDKGIMLIEDVTIKSPATEKFIPYMLNAELNEFVAENDEFATIYPTACKDKESKCINGCFFKKEIRVTHSAKNNDISKIIYRIIGKKPFAENIVVSSKGKTEYNSCIIK
ncbi:NERD domain-containing protein [Leyella stercorea]